MLWKMVMQRSLLTIMYSVLMDEAFSVMIKKECPKDEIHISCSFYNEYTCWESEQRLVRVKELPKRLQHCKGGCVCRNGLVRSYPHGACIQTVDCRNRQLAELMSKLPLEFPSIFK